MDDLWVCSQTSPVLHVFTLQAQRLTGTQSRAEAPPDAAPLYRQIYWHAAFMLLDSSYHFISMESFSSPTGFRLSYFTLQTIIRKRDSGTARVQSSSPLRHHSVQHLNDQPTMKWIPQRSWLLLSSISEQPRKFYSLSTQSRATCLTSNTVYSTQPPPSLFPCRSR